MKRFLTSALSLAILTTLGTGVLPASAKTCRDAHGKFMKCPSMMMKPAPKRCRDSHGKFMKCSSSMSSMKHKM